MNVSIVDSSGETVTSIAESEGDLLLHIKPAAADPLDLGVKLDKMMPDVFTLKGDKSVTIEWRMAVRLFLPYALAEPDDSNFFQWIPASILAQIMEVMIPGVITDGKVGLGDFAERLDAVYAAEPDKSKFLYTQAGSEEADGDELTDDAVSRWSAQTRWLAALTGSDARAAMAARPTTRATLNTKPITARRAPPSGRLAPCGRRRGLRRRTHKHDTYVVDRRRRASWAFE